jgi:SPP1 family predicted phage head-tail adaptor
MPDPSFDAGSMRNRVKLQVRSMPVAGPAGDDAPTWSDVGTYYAEVKPLTGRLLFLAQQAKSTSDYSVRMRNTQPIDVFTHRLIYRGVMVLGIDNVNREDNRNEFYQITATNLRGEIP